MKKIAALFTALPLACGLLVAQTDSQQSSSQQTTTTTTTTETKTQPATSTSSTTRTTDTHALPTITHWKGILVDASCASGAKSTASTVTTSTTDQSGSANRSSVTNQSGTTPDQSGITTGTQNPPAATTTSSDQTASSQTTTIDSGRHHKGHRNRDASAQSCPVSSSTSMFALKTQDGQVLRFDSVGNARAAAELKNKPKWTKDLADGKPIKATVDGMMSGDTVTVTDVH
jgi:hypothetical protein